MILHHVLPVEEVEEVEEAVVAAVVEAVVVPGNYLIRSKLRRYGNYYCR
jgi:hypothetical protein